MIQSFESPNNTDNDDQIQPNNISRISASSVGRLRAQATAVQNGDDINVMPLSDQRRQSPTGSVASPTLLGEQQRPLAATGSQSFNIIFLMFATIILIQIWLTHSHNTKMDAVLSQLVANQHQLQTQIININNQLVQIHSVPK